MYILDTDTCIFFMKGNGKVISTLQSLKSSQIFLSALTVHELECGVKKATIRVTEKRAALDELKLLFTILPFGEEEAVQSANIRSTLEKKGTPIGTIDNLIAGIAIFHNMSLVTNNEREFKRVDGLQVENWTT